MKKLLFIIFLSAFSLFSQSTAGSRTIHESHYIVDMPTAGILHKNKINVEAEAFDRGGLLLGFKYSPVSRLSTGLNFGGSRIIGNDEVKWQNLPGIYIAFRALNERTWLPAFTLGFDTQGKGGFSMNEKRFEFMSPGAYLAISKSFVWDIGYLAFHGGINYSLEPDPDDRGINYWIGLEQSVSEYGSIMFEYNPSLTEEDSPYTNEKGFLNLSYRYSIHQGVTFELKLRDLLKNIEGSNNFKRIFKVEVIRSF